VAIPEHRATYGSNGRTYLIPLCRFIPSKVPCTGARTTKLNTIVRVQSNNPREQCIGARRQGRPHHLGSVEPPGATAPPRPAAPAQHGK
jgi:hypothetical protein